VKFDNTTSELLAYFTAHAQKPLLRSFRSQKPLFALATWISYKTDVFPPASDVNRIYSINVQNSVYTLVNGSITHQKQQKYKKKGDIMHNNIAKVSMYC